MHGLRALFPFMTSTVTPLFASRTHIVPNEIHYKEAGGKTAPKDVLVLGGSHFYDLDDGLGEAQAICSIE